MNSSFKGSTFAGDAIEGSTLKDSTEVLGEALFQIKNAAKSGIHSFIFSAPPSFPQIDGLSDEAPTPLLKLAACEFAAEAFAEYGEEHIEMARQGHHTNLRFIAPEGRSFLVADADAVIKEIYSTPRGGFKKKIVVCEQFHTADESVATRLLKVIEEPPATAVLILLTEAALPETIVSRCVEIHLSAVRKTVVQKYLQENGVAEQHLEMLSEAAAGDLGRAHFLALNESYDRRFEIWGAIPQSLEGNLSGSSVARQVKLVREFLDELNADLTEQFKSDESLKREKRRIRDAEIKFGLFVMEKYFHSQLIVDLEADVDQNLLSATGKDTAGKKAAEKIKSLNKASRLLEGNPNEITLLSNLFFDLAA